jgi:hypothetical protein
MTAESSLTTQSYDSQEEVCPICLLPPSDELKFCAGPCLHRICVPDAERILLTKPQLPLQGENPDPYLLIPTLGRCPICRRGMSLFEMKLEDGEDLCAKNTDASEWPITGITFSERGRLSVSFDPVQGPSLSWYATQYVEPQEVLFFQQGCHFHDQSRTFHGSVALQDDKHKLMWGDISLLSCIFQFSFDLRFVSLGVIMDEEHRLVHLMGLGSRMLYSSGPPRPSERPTYHSSTLWGNTFCQGFKVGLASYHFQTNEEAFISYEHPVSSQWPPLDDGSPIPGRMFFRNAAWDATERVFRGEICWQEDCGTTWQGFGKWKYQMRFDSSYTFIASGTVESIIGEDGDPREMSNFGDDLVYINAAVDERFRSLVERFDEAQEQVWDRFYRLSGPLRQEWASEGASVRVISMLHHAFTKNIMGSASPVDFNLQQDQF